MGGVVYLHERTNKQTGPDGDGLGKPYQSFPAPFQRQRGRCKQHPCGEEARSRPLVPLELCTWDQTRAQTSADFPHDITDFTWVSLLSDLSHRALFSLPVEGAQLDSFSVTAAHALRRKGAALILQS